MKEAEYSRDVISRLNLELVINQKKNDKALVIIALHEKIIMFYKFSLYFSAQSGSGVS